MRSPLFSPLRWLIQDTFRQARASGLLWVMLSISAICILVCLSIGVTAADAPFQPGETREFLPRGDRDAGDPARLERNGVDVPRGELSFAFGTIRVPLNRYKAETVHFVELLLAGGVADSLGILLALIWTAGFLPTFLESSRASVLLTKPVPRWVLLLGKYLGVVAFVLVQAALFVGGTWAALGLRTGIWDAAYLWCIPMLVLEFATLFSFSILLAVTTGSTVVCVLGSLLYWLMCWGVNYGRLTLHTLPEVQSLALGLKPVLEASYWILPKPADFSLLLFDALHAKYYFVQSFDIQALQRAGVVQPALSAATSLLSAGVTLAVAARKLSTTDY